MQQWQRQGHLLSFLRFNAFNDAAAVAGTLAASICSSSWRPILLGGGTYHKLTHASSDLLGVEVRCRQCMVWRCLRSLILFHFVVIT